MSSSKNSNRPVNRAIVDAWRAAAEDLVIKVTAPFMLVTEGGDAEFYEALVHDFGGPRGTLTGICTRGYDDPMASRKKAGYFASNLASRYQHYDRDLFVATLDDWGWFGEKGKEPPWYTGKPWS